MIERGAKGEQGPDGRDGPRGDQGRRGQTGRDGEPGVAGPMPATSESRTDANLTLDADCIIVDASSTFTQMTMTDRSAMIGVNVIEAFGRSPEMPDADAPAKLAGAIERARRGEPVVLPVQRWDMRLPDGSGYVPRWWLINVSPLFADDLVTGYAIHIEDRTMTVLNQHGLIAQGKKIRAGRIGEYVRYSVLLVGVVVALVLQAVDVNRIQNQRVMAALASCIDSNHRHDGTLVALRGVLLKKEHSVPAAARAAIAASEAPTTLLIDALAPKRDCRAVVKAFTGVTVSRRAAELPPVPPTLRAFR